MSRPDEDDPPRMDLINHLRELIEHDAEGYANPAKMRATASALHRDLGVCPDPYGIQGDPYRPPYFRLDEHI